MAIEIKLWLNWMFFDLLLKHLDGLKIEFYNKKGVVVSSVVWIIWQNKGILELFVIVGGDL